jgi:hypothetical protein
VRGSSGAVLAGVAAVVLAVAWATRCRGWRPITGGVPQAVAVRARELLHVMNLGDVVVESYGWKTYRYLCETHPGDSGNPRPHDGVTVFECGWKA